ncbi:MAG TPA: GNAT family N-acetyltransferase [Gammaproteobacteria bacterium]|nr:GNAT family N-acetyltransferase [Gammaproteobacteria bacterium]
MPVRALTSADAAAFQQLRLDGLRRYPSAFAAHYDEEFQLDVSEIAARIAPTADNVVCGAFQDSVLVGIVGLKREVLQNLRHKALLWGMYVAPEVRGKRLGGRLLNYVLDEATRMHGVRQVNLWVNTAAPTAVALYRAAGFEEIGTESAFLMVDGISQDLTLMVRVLEHK